MIEQTNGVNFCPYLGLWNDSATSLGFPSEANCCYRFNPPVNVKFDHQENFCLGKEYLSCPVYQGLMDRKLIEWDEVEGSGRNQNRKSLNRAALLIALFALILIITLGVAYWRGWWVFSRGTVPVSPTSTKIESGTTPTAFLTATFSVTPIVKDTPTLPLTATSPATVSPTATLRPSNTPTNVPTTKMSSKYTIHQVKPGEGLEILAKQYQTTPEAIKALNYYIPTPLWSDWLIVIPVGIKNPEGLPSLQAYINYTEGITLADLAKKLVTDVSLLAELNAMNATDKIAYKQPLIVPRVKSTVP